MIESISLRDIATYSATTPETLSNLKEINFFYGANGAGKTTISRLIFNPQLSSTSHVTWSKNNPIPAHVYNNDFITANFTDSKQFKGVFTLGQAQQEQLDRLDELQKERVRHEQLRNKALEALGGPDGNGGKNAEKNALEAGLVAKCWEQKLKHDEDFQDAFTGVRGNKESFKNKVLLEKKNNTSSLADLESLKKKAKIVYGEAPSPMSGVASLDLSRLIAYEQDPSLAKKIVGKEDVNISAMIQSLGSSDWVRQGMKFLEHTDDDCPFCQQKLPHDFEKNLEDYFDATFESDTKALSQFHTNYNAAADSILSQMGSIIATDCTHLDKEKLDLEFQALSSIIQVNRQRLENKLARPSSVAELETIADIQVGIAGLIEAANVKVAEHNNLVAGLSAEQKKLAGEVWKYLVDVELKGTLTDYEQKTNALDKAIGGINTSLGKAKSDITAAEVEISEIEKTLTSVKPTVNAINKILKDFGFRSFSLDPACEDNAYKIVRGNGSDAKATLSEGEKTFVTFLYFYHLLKGSITTSGISSDRIVVIDDPVSSLDSDVLFIVSSLIKQLFAEVREKGSNLKQIFVLTHNVHFHKEITFHPERKADRARPEETFWIIRKPADYSLVESYAINPIRTSYQLLWTELTKAPVSALTIQNTMRRILENYFKILGGINTQKLIEKFEGHEKTQCQSLISWVNDGSHYSPDELYVAIGDGMASSYMRIFYKVFKAMDHMAHYRMMMGDHFVDLDPEDPLADPEGENAPLQPPQDFVVATGAVGETGATPIVTSPPPAAPIVIPAVAAKADTREITPDIPF
ncbi:AAA family ATPase [Pseudomonas sp. CNPSo 3701]|uniref:AAA family ATPase n=1 Tax=Pseudomonas sp. CNPSo 3701 TaxID=3027943 RepID=UPI0023632C36|nr:AAA family ATPase [Pseudomonas sp. CNPSo 3701]MDD1507722.1 AAA family ATPase [Pseudomonas sp. CNPSo 3701]